MANWFKTKDNKMWLNLDQADGVYEIDDKVIATLEVQFASGGIWINDPADMARLRVRLDVAAADHKDGLVMENLWDVRLQQMANAAGHSSIKVMLRGMLEDAWEEFNDNT